MPPVLRRLAVLLPMLVLLAPAAAVTRLATIDLVAPLVAGRASEDGATLVVLLQEPGGGAARLQVYDTRDPQHPQARGALELPSGGDMALSGDGRRLLLRRPLERAAYNRETGHELLAIDLAEGATPRVLWRDTVSARQVVLASQADAFAYSRRIGRQDEGWETVVVSVADRSQRVLAEGAGFNGRSALSPHGRHLVQSDGARLRIWNLAPAGPALHEQPPVFGDRYAHDCTFAALDSGDVLVSDGRGPRLGVYRAEADVPRAARLALDDPGCTLLNPNAADRAFALADAFGGVSVIDLARPSAPARGPSWQLPVPALPFAMAHGVLLAATERPAALTLWRADASDAEPVDGRGLAAAHRDALAALADARRAGNRGGPWAAVAALEAAGVVPAIAARVVGIDDRQAAAVFNDYGFLAARAGRPARIVEATLRRAIALDPRRAVARLNLADTLREGLGRQAATGGDAEARRREIEALYRAFLALGGQATPAVTAFLAGDPSAGTTNECDAIAAWANAGRLPELLSDVGTDLRLGQRRIDLVFGTEGTAHVPVFRAYDAADRALDDDTLPDVAPMTGGDGQLALLTIRGRHHVVHHQDVHHPTATVPLDGGSACRFQVTTRVTVGPGATEPGLCAALQADRAGARLAFEAPAAIEAGDVLATWAETTLVGTRMLDVENNGVPRTVAELRLTSGAGAGCEATFYDLLDADGAAFQSGPARDLLLRLQGARAGERFPVRCGNEPGFLSYRGRTYFTSRPADWPPTRDADHYRRVSTVRDGRVVDVCDFRFRASVAAARR